MRKLALAAAVLLLVPSLPALADVSGVWSGSYNATLACSGGNPASSQGTAAASLFQSGNSVDGALSLQGFTSIDDATCTPGTPSTISASLNGTLNGTSFNGTLALTTRSVAVTGTMTDSSVSLTISDAKGSQGTITLSRANNLPPPAINIGGTWTGTSNEVAVCTQPVQATGNMTLTIQQNGYAYSGTVTFDQKIVNCASGAPVSTTDTVNGFVYGSDFSVIISDPQLGIGSGGGSIANGQLVFAVEFQTGGTLILEGILNQTVVGPPVIASFSATPSIVSPGQSSTLSWTTLGATSVSIDNGVGVQAASGSTPVAPSATTTYTLTASGQSGTATASATVTVGNSTPPANINIGQYPTGMLEPAGSGGATDHYTIVNSGGTAATITLSQSGSFFTQSPTSFTIPAGGSQTIVITANAQPAGSYDGASIVSGGGANFGIPIHLVVATPPSGTVAPAVVGNVRLETSGDPGQTQASGAVPFTNTGSATLQGIATSDVPWLIPQSGVITIAPGATVSIVYSIDRTRRPDAGSLLGGQTATLSLKFLSGTGRKAITALDATSTTSTVSVTLVDVVKPGVTAGTPPPLSAGEVAYFVAGIASNSNATGDLLLGNRGNAPVTDLKLFYGSAGGPPAQFAAISSLAANTGVAFPSVVRTVFGKNAQVGSLQLRSSQLANVSIGTVQVNTATAKSYVTALPVLRSDRGAGSGASLYLVGVVKSGSQKTNLELQEMSGAATTAATDFINGSGTVIGSRTDSLPAFGFLDLADVVPAGATTVRVRNTTAGVIGAYATVVDVSTNDLIVVTDAATPSADTLFAPIVPGAHGSSVVYVTNASGAAVPVSATVLTTAGHAHAAAHGAAAAANRGATSNFILNPLVVGAVQASNWGFIKLTAPAGALHGSGMFSASGANGLYGSGLPLLTSAAALANGSAKRFSGVEDASAATVARATPATYRTNLMLIETAGDTATVQVTLRFNYVSGPLTATQVTTSKNFEVAAGSFLLISDLGRAVIGQQRDAIGDLHNMQVDVSVVGGNGKVIPVLESIDNSSGDVAVRTE